MNARRAANRAASRRRAEHDDDLKYTAPETHESMRGRRIPHRYPEHHEEGGNYRHESHASHGSPASKGASKGPGPLPGAGELPAVGPGPTRDLAEIAEAPEAAPGRGPASMPTYSQE